MKIALISDIHGNSFALEAVFDDIAGRNIDLIFNLGDILYGPLDPMGTFKLLETRGMLSISGNQDRFILENLGQKTGNETMNYVLNQLNDTAIDFLKALPFDYNHDSGVYLCHATPQKGDEYLIEKLFESHVGVKENDEIEAILKNIEEKIVVCGHSHQPHVVKTVSKTVINPGSVGLPAYDDDLPIFHKMENYNNNANYCVLSVDNEGNASVERISIPYDFELVAKMAEKNNRPDWAKWLRTGRA